MKKLNIAFLWHMHQPLYKDFTTGKYFLPWVRLHSTFSYLDMAAVLEDFPKAKVTFNLTPSLIMQLKDYMENDEASDNYYELSKKEPYLLTEDEKIFILRNFFSCDHKTQIYPIERYARLLYRRGNDLDEAVLKKKLREFSENDLRDIQVFFNLAWCGFTLREKDKVVNDLFKKGALYTETDKQALLEKQKEVVKSILPLYKKLLHDGKIEISTTPLYHPILPLLCKGDNQNGYDFQEDAKLHVDRAMTLYRQTFGAEPSGMWPAEGSVSKDIIPILAHQGVKWMATDEAILFNSLDKSAERLELYNAYIARSGKNAISMLFRDINISNSISFRYSNMTGKDAVHEIMHNLHGIHKAFKDKDDHIVPIILDGENPWPYFYDGGKEFLKGVYHEISISKEFELTTVSGYLEAAPERKEIRNLYRGSWISANFDKWIGSPQKNRAWEYLAKARKDLFSSSRITPEALEELYIAEGSDWFWWYDDFGNDLNLVFDEIFRDHLMNIYRLSGQEVPKYLEEPIPSGPSLEVEYESARASVMGFFPRVLIAASEVIPFAKTGGLADVVGSLAKSLVSLGSDVRIIMPLYKSIKESGIKLHLISKKVSHPLLKRLKPFDLYSYSQDGVKIYFVDTEKLFNREELYGTTLGDYQDNYYRFANFSQAVLAAIKETDFKPDVIHCNDWQTALVPFYLRFVLNEDPYYAGVRTLFTIHNMAFQGIFSKHVMKRIGIPETFFSMNDLEFYGKINFMKAGILYSDAISTVSHRYAREIMTPKYGCGLDGLITARKEFLYGIINGADYSVWSPEKDIHIKANYNADSIEKKFECKKDLIEYTGLVISPERPILGTVGRLTAQKGMDMYADIIKHLMTLDLGIVVLGKGNDHLNGVFKALADKYPGRVYVGSGFNDPLAHKIEAGADIFVMPSRYEPCGLNQMYSIKYGTIPVVRATGGLDDAIVDYDKNPDKANGFKFIHEDKEALYECIEHAVNVYQNKEEWKRLMKQAMSYDFSWSHSAGQYLKLYRRLMAAKIHRA